MDARIHGPFRFRLHNVSMRMASVAHRVGCRSRKAFTPPPPRVGGARVECNLRARVGFKGLGSYVAFLGFKALRLLRVYSWLCPFGLI